MSTGISGVAFRNAGEHRGSQFVAVFLDVADAQEATGSCRTYTDARSGSFSRERAWRDLKRALSKAEAIYVIPEEDVGKSVVRTPMGEVSLFSATCFPINLSHDLIVELMRRGSLRS